jgi:hypothetical protein
MTLLRKRQVSALQRGSRDEPPILAPADDVALYRYVDGPRDKSRVVAICVIGARDVMYLAWPMRGRLSRFWYERGNDAVLIGPLLSSRLPLSTRKIPEALRTLLPKQSAPLTTRESTVSIVAA